MKVMLEMAEEMVAKLRRPPLRLARPQWPKKRAAG
jgi:hypothetical protein